MRLHVVAAATNYGLARDTPMEREVLENVAYTMILFCRDIASGVETWESSIEHGMSRGATHRDVTTMDRFLRTEFCPAVR